MTIYLLLCAANLKQVNRWVIFALTKSPCNVYFAQCQCPAGTSGTCSHAFALMKIVTKWVADGLAAVACTSKPQYWSIPQTRGRVTEIPIPEMNVVAVGKESTTDKNRQSNGGRRSTLYEARAPCARIDTGIPAVNVSPNQESLPTLATSYGHVPVGPILSNQCCMMPFDFKSFQLYQWHFMD